MDPKFNRDVMRFLILSIGIGFVTYAILEVLSKRPKSLVSYEEDSNVVPFKRTVH